MKRTHLALSAALAAILAGGGSTLRAEDAAPDAGALFQKLDKNGDGKLTASEIPEEQQQFFDRLVRRGDKNSDGELTREEFEQANKPDERPNVQLGGPGAEQGRADARQRFEMLDRNKDGKVTLDEVPEPLRDRLKPIFERSGKQELTFEEFGRLASGGVRPEPGDMFGRLDTNGDGKLTIDEAPERARPMLENLFRRAGKEKGGSVTKEEFVKNFEPPRGPGDQPVSERRPEGDRPRDTDRRPAGDQPQAERRADGNLPRDGERRPAGDAPAGDRRPEGRMEGRGPGPLFFRMLDTNQDGRLSKDEWAKAAEKFDELDRNHDGQLDPSELFGPPPEGRGPGRDAAGERANPPRDNGPRGDGARREPDATGRPGANAPAREGRPEPGARGERGAFFQRLDRDGDGKISKDEAPEAMKERFSMLDTNGDGFISQDEMRAGAQQLGDRLRNNRQPEGRPEPKRE